MLVARSIDHARRAVAEARAAGQQIAFVPTMGALHAGHTSLIDAARDSSACVVVSIYVNPTQFGPNEDFTIYPRTFEADSEAAMRAGTHLLFAPSDREIYPEGDQTRVHPGPLAEKLCGPYRPGHFEGVCTVVAKLFNIIQPDIAYFGQKDAQQALIIQRMVEDLRMPVRIIVCPTVRDPDGLAMSSRNARLAPKDRAMALSLYKSLCLARDRLIAGENSLGRIIAAMRSTIGEHAEIRVDYLSIVDAATLETPLTPAGRLLIAGAIRIGRTRLIDNLVVDLPTA